MKFNTALRDAHLLSRLLGSGGAQEWKEYQNSLSARMQVRQLKINAPLRKPF